MAVGFYLAGKPTRQRSLFSETAPDVIYGTGAPDGDVVPWSVVNKGSLYMQADGADDGAVLWVKVDEGGDDADWKRVGVQYLRSKTFNIDNGSGTTDDDVIAIPEYASTVLAAKIVYVEATDTAGVASANVKLGTAVGGAQIVAATALEISKAVGAETALTIAAGAVAADGAIFVRHTGIAATEGGQYYVQVALV